VHNHILVASPLAGMLFDRLGAQSPLHDLLVLALGLRSLLVTLGLLHRLSLFLLSYGLRRSRHGAIMALTQMQEMRRPLSAACRALATDRASIFSRSPIVVLEAFVG